MRTSLFILALLLASCTSTVTPQPVASTQASFDGNQQTSGVLVQDINGYVVTTHFHDRWLALVEVYGRDFKPPVDAKAGWLNNADGTWRMDKQRMIYFLEMNAWLRAGLKPVNP